MKPRSAAFLLTALSALSPQLSTFVHAQGSLTPPGPPGAVMKTLDQIESRTPIGTAPFTISQGGSYYLTANLTVATGNAITITADDVTLDLNGFTIKSTASPAQGAGVWLAGTAAATVGNRCVSITNGTIAGAVTRAGSVFTGAGFRNGVACTVGTTPQMVEATQLKVRGVSGTALQLGQFSIARNCVVRLAGASGIYAHSVVNCQAHECGNIGISADLVDSSYGQSVGTSPPTGGIFASVRAIHSEGVATGAGEGLSAVTAIGCTGSSASSNGLYCEIGRDCTGFSDSHAGLKARLASQCAGISNTGIGLDVIEANTCTGNSNTNTGIRAENAMLCYAVSNNSVPNGPVVALDVSGTATSCRGVRPGGTPVKAAIAVSCSGTVTAPQKFLGTP